MSWKQAWIALAAVVGIGAPLALAPFTKAAAQVQEGIAAIVNEDIITTFDVRQRATLLLASSELEPNRENQQRAQVQALRDLIDETLQLQEAARFEIEVTDQQIDENIAELASQGGATQADLEGQLLAAGIRPQTLRDQVRAEIAWRRVVNGLFGSRIRISAAEVEATQARIAANAQRAQYQVSEIFLPAETPAEFSEARANGQVLLEEMQRGAPFPLVARQFSAAASAAQGGDLGWVAAGELAPAIQNVLDFLEPGQVSMPIATERGVYIIALRDRRDGVVPGMDTISALRVTAPASSEAALNRARTRIAACAGLASAADDVPGAEIQDLGFAVENTLPSDLRAQVAGLEPGEASAVQPASGGVALVVLCSRDSSAAGVPTRDQIEDRLWEEEMTMLAQRHLRDLRREASITSP
ncbi:MAG: peptidylprolyl isomerase [Alphaproteobacteria bacterium]|nr:peptidylprolyl isomerase [Alphaproteobacteria bacterium]